jgi:hypothetical protein
VGALIMPTIPLEKMFPDIAKMPTININKLFNDVAQDADFLVLYVKSRRPGHLPWRIDKQKFCGNGECQCEHFTASLTVNNKTMTMRQALKAGALPSEKLKCYHIKRADQYLLQKMLNAVIEQREKLANENKQAAKANRSVGQRVPEPARPTDSACGGTPDDAPRSDEADVPN